MATNVLYCSDPLNERRPDAHFAGEARALRAAGAGLALIDHDALLAGDPGRAVARVPAGAGRSGTGAGWSRPGGTRSSTPPCASAAANCG